MDPKEQKEQAPDAQSSGKLNADQEKPASSEIKNASASGLGAMGGHDEDIRKDTGNLSADEY